MPIGPYPDFAACVAAQKKRGKSDEAAHKICGYIEHQVKKAHEKKNMASTEGETARMLLSQGYVQTPEGQWLHVDTKEFAAYPWDKCVADRKEEGKSDKAAAAICGSIKRRSQG
jgi:hypothetical protein